MARRFRKLRSRSIVIGCVIAVAGAGTGAGIWLAGSGGNGDEPASARVEKGDPLAYRPKPDPDPVPKGAAVIPVSPPVSPQEYLLDDMGWREVTGAKVKFVYAGADAENTSQGIVLVVTSLLPPADPPPDFERQDTGVHMTFNVYPTPKQVGPVQIASATGRTIRLATSDGKIRFTFDAGRETYVSG
jgi:hypothetical protein